jgi:hypothetical protein
VADTSREQTRDSTLHPPSCCTGRISHVAGARLDAQRQSRLDEELRRLLWIPLPIVDEVGTSPSTRGPPTYLIVLARLQPVRSAGTRISHLPQGSSRAQRRRQPVGLSNSARPAFAFSSRISRSDSQEHFDCVRPPLWARSLAIPTKTAPFAERE